jgi:hypothetical protein
VNLTDGFALELFVVFPHSLILARVLCPVKLAHLSCAWTAQSNVAWLTITAGTSGTGNGTVSYTVAANNTPDPRTGTLTIAGRTFTVTQPGTTIPARAQYLCVNAAGYSLAAQAAADETFNADLPDDAGLALFRTSDPQQFTTGNVLDAVGFNSAATEQAGALAAAYREGTPLAPVGAGVGASEQYAYVRKMTNGMPQDTGDNAQDFMLISTTGTVGGQTAQLGAPAPENAQSLIQRNAQLKASLIDPQQSSTAAPNRIRDLTAVGNGQLGTLTIRRKFTNKTGQPVTALRFRIVDMTTLNSPSTGSQADLRALDSTDITVQTTSGASVLVKGTALNGPLQALGGGLNSALVVGLPGGALAPNASVNVQFVLGVQQAGSFRFLVNVEALPGAGVTAQKVGAKTGREK